MRRAFCTVVPLLLIFLLTTPLLAQAKYELEVGGGVLIPFDNETRDVYGSGGSFLVSGAAQAPDRQVWFFVETGLVKASGQEFEPDPTFELDDSKFTIWPLLFGFRTDLLRTEGEDNLDLLFAAGIQSLFTSWEDPFGEKESDPSFGVVFDIGPRLRTSDRFGIWIRQRFSFSGETKYENSPSNFDFAGTYIQGGLTYYFPQR